MVRTFEEIQAMAADPWSNDACRGYVIWAMENCGFKPKEIKQVVAELYMVLTTRPLKKQPDIIMRVLFNFRTT